MCLGFVMANSPGYPWKWWAPHAGDRTPELARLVAGVVDVIMLNGYLVLNLAIPFYIHYSHFVGREPCRRRNTFPLIYISVVWAVSIHLVHAHSSSPASRPAPSGTPALLGPTLLASAFTAGPAFMILLLGFIGSQSRLRHPPGSNSENWRQPRQWLRRSTS
jgi:molybdopterin-containing oxidoreductase family membrane subunit